MINSTNSTINASSCSSGTDSYFEGFTGALVTHVSLTLALLGIPTNILSLIVLRRDASKTTTRFLLMALAVEDLLLIIFYALYYIAVHYFENYGIAWLGYIRFADSPILFMINWTKMVEIYTVVLVSVDRYIAIRFPLKAVTMCRVSNAARGLAVIVLATFLLKLPNLILDYKTMRWIPECQTYTSGYLFEHHHWLPHFQLIYIQIVDQVSSYIIPLASLIILNTCLIFKIRNASQQREGMSGGLTIRGSMRGNGQSTIRQRNTSQKTNVTLTLIGVVTLFILCETPTSLVFFHAIYCMLMHRSEDDQFLLNVYPAALILLLANCASNFFVYILIGRKFRNLFIAIFCRCTRRLSRHSATNQSMDNDKESVAMCNSESKPKLNRALLSSYAHHT